MSDSKISVRYARSLFLLAKEKGIIDAIKSDIELIEQSIRDIPDFEYLVDNPVLKASEKSKIFKNIFEDKLNILTINFFDLLIKNKREAFLKNISRNFLDLCRKENGILKALFISAHSLTAQQSDDVEKLIQKTFNSKIELTQKVDEKLIGGYILRVDDHQIDASVATKLAQIKQELLNTIVS